MKCGARRSRFFFKTKVIIQPPVRLDHRAGVEIDDSYSDTQPVHSTSQSVVVWYCLHGAYIHNIHTLYYCIYNIHFFHHKPSRRIVAHQPIMFAGIFLYILIHVILYIFVAIYLYIVIYSTHSLE